MTQEIAAAGLLVLTLLCVWSAILTVLATALWNMLSRRSEPARRAAVSEPARRAAGEATRSVTVVYPTAGSAVVRSARRKRIPTGLGGDWVEINLLPAWYVNREYLN